MNYFGALLFFVCYKLVFISLIKSPMLTADRIMKQLKRLQHQSWKHNSTPNFEWTNFGRKTLTNFDKQTNRPTDKLNCSEIKTKVHRLMLKV